MLTKQLTLEEYKERIALTTDEYKMFLETFEVKK